MMLSCPHHKDVVSLSTSKLSMSGIRRFVDLFIYCRLVLVNMFSHSGVLSVIPVRTVCTCTCLTHSVFWRCGLAEEAGVTARVSAGHRVEEQ